MYQLETSELKLETNLMPKTFADLVELMDRLRSPGGCPWDREQTYATLAPMLLEEAYEAFDALEEARLGRPADLREELGDLLLLVLMHAEIAADAGRFSIEHVIGEISDKLVRRHPHVFGTSDARDADAVLKQWEALKREEKGTVLHYLASLPKALPALVHAQKAQSKAARVNFDWTALSDVMAKVEEELLETKEAIQSGKQELIEHADNHRVSLPIAPQATTSMADHSPKSLSAAARPDGCVYTDNHEPVSNPDNACGAPTRG